METDLKIITPTDPTYEFGLLKQGGTATLHKNGNPNLCPWQAPTIYAAQDYKGQQVAKRENQPCSSGCALFELATYNDKSGARVTLHCVKHPIVYQIKDENIKNVQN